MSAQTNQQVNQQTISRSFKSKIEEETKRIEKTNPLTLAAERGSFTPQDLEVYLQNLMFFAHHSPMHLERARRRSVELGFHELADFYQAKVKEESGHDQWAKNDLKRVGFPDQVDLKKIQAGTLRLLAHAKECIDQNPALFIPYMLFLEYFTVLAAPKFLSHLESKCAIPREALTMVGNHAELDKDHVSEDLEVLDWSSEFSTRENLEATMADTIRYFEEMIGQCVSAK